MPTKEKFRLKGSLGPKRILCCHHWEVQNLPSECVWYSATSFWQCKESSGTTY